MLKFHKERIYELSFYGYRNGIIPEGGIKRNCGSFLLAFFHDSE
jgi:hypothetical protein